MCNETRSEINNEKDANDTIVITLWYLHFCVITNYPIKLFRRKHKHQDKLWMSKCLENTGKDCFYKVSQV